MFEAIYNSNRKEIVKDALCRERISSVTILKDSVALSNQPNVLLLQRTERKNIGKNSKEISIT